MQEDEVAGPSTAAVRAPRARALCTLFVIGGAPRMRSEGVLAMKGWLGRTRTGRVRCRAALPCAVPRLASQEGVVCGGFKKQQQQQQQQQQQHKTAAAAAAAAAGAQTVEADFGSWDNQGRIGLNRWIGRSAHHGFVGERSIVFPNIAAGVRSGWEFRHSTRRTAAGTRSRVRMGGEWAWWHGCCHCSSISSWAASHRP